MFNAYPSFLNQKITLPQVVIGIYVLAYTFPFPFGAIPGTRWIAEQLLRFPQFVIVRAYWLFAGNENQLITFHTGSGDTLYRYLYALTCLFTAIVLAYPIWRLLRNRGSDLIIRQFFQTYLLLYLSSSMMIYSVVKLTMSQFTEPSFQMLLSPLGDLSSMELMWNFYGYSSGYNLVLGGVELLVALLILFPRTRTLGSFLGFLTLIQVVTMNLFYNIPVKLHSLHMLALFGLALWPNRKSIIKGLLPHIAFEVPPPQQTQLIFRRVMLIGLILFSVKFSWDFFHYRNAWGDYTPTPHYFGLYEIVHAESSDQLKEWKYFAFDKIGTFDLYDQDLKIHRLTYTKTKTGVIISNSKAIQELEIGPTNETVKFVWMSPQGTFKGIAKKWEKKDFRLLNRKFEWIQGYPDKRDG